MRKITVKSHGRNTQYPRAGLWRKTIAVDWFNVIGAPDVQASSVTIDNISATQFRINVVSGNGTGRVFVVKVGAAVNSNPANGTPYTANTTFGSGTQIGSGNYVVGNANVTTITVTHDGTRGRYDVAVYESNGTSYNTTGAPTASVVNPKLITGLAGWIDASQITGLADGAEITALTEHSGLGKVLTPSAGSRNPTYETNEINGLPVIRFSATSDNFQGVKADWNFLHQGNNTHIQLFKRTSSAAGFIFDSDNGSSANIGRAILANANNSISDSQYAGVSGQNVFSSTSVASTYPLNQWNIIVSRYEAGKSGNDHTLDINNIEVINSQGSQSPSASTSTNLPTFFNRQDGTNPVNGDLAEWIFFSVAISTEAISDLVGGASSTYGL